MPQSSSFKVDLGFVERVVNLSLLPKKSYSGGTHTQTPSQTMSGFAQLLAPDMFWIPDPFCGQITPLHLCFAGVQRVKEPIVNNTRQRGSWQVVNNNFLVGHNWLSWLSSSIILNLCNIRHVNSFDCVFMWQVGVCKFTTKVHLNYMENGFICHKLLSLGSHKSKRTIKKRSSCHFPFCLSRQNCHLNAVDSFHR